MQATSGARKRPECAQAEGGDGVHEREVPGPKVSYTTAYENDFNQGYFGRGIDYVFTNINLAGWESDRPQSRKDAPLRAWPDRVRLTFAQDSAPIQRSQMTWPAPLHPSRELMLPIKFSDNVCPLVRGGTISNGKPPPCADRAGRATTAGASLSAQNVAAPGASEDGTLLIDQDLKVVHANAVAQSLVGSVIILTKGRIAAANRKADGELKDAIQAALLATRSHAAEGRSRLTLPRRNGRPVLASVTPVYASRATDLLNVRAAITLIDLDRPAVASVEALRKAFDLTPKEGEVAAGLAQGLDIIAIAELNGTSSATVRQQVKRLFTKTNTHRQAELTLLLSRVVMSWR